MNTGDETPFDRSARSSTVAPAVREARLTDRLEALRCALADLQAPPRLESTLVAAFRARQARERRATRPRLWWMPPLALAATVAVVSWMVRAPAILPTADPPAAVALADDPGPFLALKPLARIALEPQATVVATEFPRALLAQWGMPVSPERAGEPVRAEMLYSADGEALAVRLLN